MKYFFATQETIPPGYGFTHFDGEHMLWLAVFVVLIGLNSLLYRRMDAKGRENWRKTLAVVIVSSELIRDICLIACGTFLPKYLPFHLCGINIFLIAYHAWRPTKLLDNFLYLICIPGATLAMLFSTWSMLPAFNFIYLHSFVLHILLAMYPFVLTAAGEIRPQPREFPKCILLLAAMAVPVSIFNHFYGTNFMFIAYPEPGTPLVWFEEHMGSFLWGFPVLIPIFLGLMSVPAWLLAKRREKEKVA